MFLFAKLHCGAVDRIPGIGEVQTQFYGLCGVPLVPCRSLFVTNSDVENVAGIELLGLDRRSVLTAYLRAALVLVVVVAGLSGLTGSVVAGFVCFAGLFALIASYRALGTASPERAAELVRRLRLEVTPLHAESGDLRMASSDLRLRASARHVR